MTRFLNFISQPTRPRLLIRPLAILLSLVSIIGCDKDSKPGALDRAGYHIREKVVYFLPDWTSKPFEVAGADVPTFECPLPKGSWADYARDQNHVYLRGAVMAGVDPKTFEILDDRYSRDAQNVYLGSLRVCDDSAHFSVVSGNFFRNGHAVYQFYPKVAEVSQDIAHFHEIAHSQFYSYCADQAHVYVNGNPLPDAEPATFRILQGGYSADNARTYYFNKIIPEVTDSSQLEVLDSSYAKDQAHVYYLGQVLTGAEAATFVVTDPKWPKGKDAHHEYEQGNVVAK